MACDASCEYILGLQRRNISCGGACEGCINLLKLFLEHFEFCGFRLKLDLKIRHGGECRCDIGIELFQQGNGSSRGNNVNQFGGGGGGGGGGGNNADF